MVNLERKNKVQEFNLYNIPAKDVIFSNESYGTDPEIEEARRIIEEGGDSSQIKKLNPELAKEYIKKYDGLQLPGLKEISEDVIFELLNTETDFGVFNLNGLEEISKEVATVLSQYKGKAIRLNGLKKIEGSVAAELCSFPGGLYLSGLKKITVDVAQAFATRDAFTLLDGLEDVDEATAIALIPTITNKQNFRYGKKVFEKIQEAQHKQEKGQVKKSINNWGKKLHEKINKKLKEVKYKYS